MHVSLSVRYIKHHVLLAVLSVMTKGPQACVRGHIITKNNEQKIHAYTYGGFISV